MKKIRFTSGGEQIEGTLITPVKIKEKNPGVIFFHGMTSSEKSYLPIAQRISEHGIIGMTLNIRGHGTSEGNFALLTINDAITDGLNAYDFFARYNFIDHSRIGICGGSVGGAIATILASQREVQSLVLRAPSTYTEEMMKMTYKQIMADEDKLFQIITSISATPAVRAISKFEGNLLVVTSEKDTIVPVAIPMQYLLDARNAKKKNVVMIPDATHYLSQQKWRNQFIDSAVAWFIATL